MNEEFCPICNSPLKDPEMDRDLNNIISYWSSKVCRTMVNGLYHYVKRNTRQEDVFVLDRYMIYNYNNYGKVIYELINNYKDILQIHYQTEPIKYYPGILNKIQMIKVFS